MGKTSNYTKAVMESLSKLADKVDTSGSGAGGKADFYDVVSNSLARISDNYNGSGGGGGTGGGVLVCTEDENGTLDKTWKEIYDAITGGKICLIATNEFGRDILSVVTSIATDNNTMYGVLSAENLYITNTEGGYPEKNYG